MSDLLDSATLPNITQLTLTSYVCVHQLTSCSHISEKDHFTEQWHTHFKPHWIPLQSLTSHKKQNLKCFLHEEWLRAEVNSVPKTEQWPYSKPTDFWWLQGAGSNIQPWDRIYHLLAWNCGVFIFYSLNTEKKYGGQMPKERQLFSKTFHSKLCQYLWELSGGQHWSDIGAHDEWARPRLLQPVLQRLCCSVIS